MEVMLCIWMYLNGNDADPKCAQLECSSLWRVPPQSCLVPSWKQDAETMERKTDHIEHGDVLELQASPMIFTRTQYLYVFAQERIDRVLQPWLNDDNQHPTKTWTYNDIGGHFARKWQLLHNVLKDDCIPHVILEPIVLMFNTTEHNKDSVIYDAPSAAWLLRWQRVCYCSDVRHITCPLRYQQQAEFNHVGCMMIDRVTLQINWFDPSGHWSERTNVIHEQLQTFVQTHMFPTHRMNVQPVYFGPQHVTQDSQCGNWVVLFALLCNRYPQHSYQKWLFPMCAPQPRNVKRTQQILQQFDAWLRAQAERWFAK